LFHTTINLFIGQPRIFPGLECPSRGITAKDLDSVIVRQNSQEEYAGQGGRSHRGQPHEVGTEVAISARTGVTRIMRLPSSSLGRYDSQG
jgi:tartrate dehydrogenase/decarboxylase / D-malate dehydrogenase